MRSNFNFLKPLLLCPNLSEAEFKKILPQVSSNFTKERSKIKKYVLSPEMISAYALFFVSTNYPKFFFLMNQLNQEDLEDIKKCDFIDIGTGPGTYLLSFLDFLDGKIGVDQKIIGVDSSDLMLDQAKKIVGGVFPEYQGNLSFQRPENLSLRKNSKKVLFFGHSLNEMGIQEAVKLVNNVDPNYLCFIEPGTPETFEFVLKIRKTMKEAGYDSLYPCSTLSASCPMENTNDWCHQVLRMTHDPDVERMCQLVSKNRRVMPLISHIYKKGKIAEFQKGPIKATLIRVLKETKFSFQWQVCLLEEGHKLIKVDVLKKFISKKEIKKLKKVSTGERVSFEKLKDVSEFFWQVELKGVENLVKKIPSS